MLHERLSPTSVAMVEDDASVRERLANVMQRSPGLQLLYSTATAEEMLAWLTRHAVDVLLVDLGLPDRSGLEVIRHCRHYAPATDVMVVTMFGDDAHVLEAIKAGARGYLLKDGSEDELARHVANLRSGGSPMSPLIARRLLELLSRQGSPVRATDPAAAGVKHDSVIGVLTEREMQILRILSRGYTYGETAKLLEIAASTVQTHVRNIYGKLAVRSKAEAVFEARQLGLLE